MNIIHKQRHLLERSIRKIKKYIIIDMIFIIVLVVSLLAVKDISIKSTFSFFTLYGFNYAILVKLFYREKTSFFLGALQIISIVLLVLMLQLTIIPAFPNIPSFDTVGFFGIIALLIALITFGAYSMGSLVGKIFLKKKVK